MDEFVVRLSAAERSALLDALGREVSSTVEDLKSETDVDNQRVLLIEGALLAGILSKVQKGETGG